MEDARLQNDLDVIELFAKAGDSLSLHEALERIRRCYADNADALKAIAHVLNRNDRFDEALSVARQGLTIDPDHALLHYNAARALSITGNAAKARPHSEKAAMLMPDNPWLQFHFSAIQLCLGEFEDGWRRQRWFYLVPGQAGQTVYPPFAEWKGEPLAGATFLLVGEQGRGDEIQFLQLVDWLHRQGAVVDMLSSAPIAPLAASMANIRAVYTRTPPGPYTYWSHIFRVPEFMKLKLSMLPLATNYLKATGQKADRWRRCINPPSASDGCVRKMRIGIVWAGNRSATLDRFRSVPLDSFRPLLATPGVTWYALQKGSDECDSENLKAEFDLHALGPAIEDFTDTLAILQALDLLITVDTSVAHLAGAAGVPVWVLVPSYSEWRWMMERTDSPWYPSMRLFRQREPGKQDAAIEAMRSALADLLAKRPCPGSANPSTTRAY
jgi:tetratricopeptide (TPR) repeat protein